MKRTMVMMLLTVMLLLTGCAAPSVGALDKVGIAPYAFTESETTLMNALALEDRAYLFSFQAPEEAKALEIKTYLLAEDGTWEATGGGRVSIGLDSEADQRLAGTFGLMIEENNQMEMHITTKGRASYKMTSVVSGEPVMVSAKTFLPAFRDAKINEEIPVAILIADSGSTIAVFDVDNFFSPDVFSGLDTVQAVTMTFQDHEETA